MKISVVVPVYNAEETIAQCIEALINQNYPEEDYEIVVVNDGSTDQTKQILEKYPLRLINLAKNSGHTITRETGARQAKHNLLLFVDSRVIVNKNILTQIKEINYQPLLAGDLGEDKYRSNYDALFYLIRRKVYAPYFPLRQWGEIYIDEQNFDDMPKGTTVLFCEKELFLQAVPSVKKKTISDDTKLLGNIITKRKILNTPKLRVKYLQRTDFKEVIRHIFNRGPKFADYYLVGGGKYYKFWIFSLSIALVFLVLGIYQPINFIYELLILFICLVGIAIYLSENLKDFWIVLRYFPPICVAFGMGIMRAKIAGIFSSGRDCGKHSLRRK